MGDNLLTLAALLSLLRFSAIAVSLVDFYPYSKDVGMQSYLVEMTSLPAPSMFIHQLLSSALLTTPFM